MRPRDSILCYADDRVLDILVWFFNTCGKIVSNYLLMMLMSANVLLK